MKKTLLATAVAGVLGTLATGAQAATVYNQDGSKLDVYGNVQISWRDIQNDNGNYKDDIFDNGSTIGFRGEHIINPSLTGYFRAEFEFNADEQKGYYQSYGSSDTGSGLSRGDQSYLGLTGDFGDLRAGSWDNLMDDWIDDPISNNEYFDNTESQSDIGGTRYREGERINYTSPIWSGIQFSIGTRYYGDGEDTEEFQDEYLNGTTPGEFVVDEGGSASIIGGVRYTRGGFTLAAVYDDLKNFKYVTGDGDEHDYGKQYGVNLSYQIDTLRVAAKWEQMNAQWADNADTNRYALGARYGYGWGDIYGSYQYVDAEANAVAVVDPNGYDGEGGHGEAYNEFILGATYNLSAQMYVYVEGAKYDREENTGDGVALGAVYSF